MEVWILISTAILEGAAVYGAEQTSTRAFAYASREAACDALREFMRPDVNDSRPCEAWDEDPDMTVDDALDMILSDNEDLNGDGDGFWTWDGSNRSYEWRLLQLKVRT